MSGFTRLASSLLLPAFLTVSPALAGGTDDVDPFDALKTVAKAKFEATHRTTAERARALADTARAGLLATFKEFQAGKILPETFLAWSPRVLEAELALRDEDADPAPLYERNWRVACEAERIAEVKIQAGKIDVADAAEARSARLQAERDWLAHRGHGGKKPTFIELTPEGDGHPTDADVALAQQQRLAREEWEAIQADPHQLAQELRQAAREGLRATLQEFRDGKVTPEVVLEWTLRDLDANLVSRDRDADPTPLLERRWKTLRRIEEGAAVKLQVGKLAASDLETCRCLRLAAEIAWRQARQGAEKPGGRNRPAVDDDTADDADWARAKEKASRADLRDLLRERLRAARDANRDIDQEFQAGQLTVELPLEASLLLLEAEYAAASGPKEKAAALERHWRRGLDLEAVAERKLGEGKIAVADVMEARFARQEAEMWIAAWPGQDR